MAREKPIPSDTLLSLGPHGPGQSCPETPSRVVMRKEREGWVRLAIELLSPADREIIVLRDWDRKKFAEIGRHFDLAEAAARMRYKSALVRLAAKVGALRRGRLDEVLEGGAA